MHEHRHLLLVLTIAGFALLYFLWPVMMPGIVFDSSGLHLTNGQDFLNYWAAPQIAMRDVHILFDGAAYDEARSALTTLPGDEWRWSYPLYLLFFLKPLGALSYAGALAVWSLLGLMLYLSAVWASLPEHERRNGMLLLMASPIVIVELLTRQSGFFTSAGALAVLLLLQHRRPVLAGILLGCLTVKPQLFLLWPLILLMERQWRTIIAASFMTLALAGLSLQVHGLTAWQEFFATAPAFQWQLVNNPAVFTPHHLYQLMMPGPTVALRLLHAPDMLVYGIQGLVSVVVIIGTILAWRQSLSLGQRALILASGGLLVTPYAFNYDMGFFTAALLLRWIERPTLNPYQSCVRNLAYLLPLLVYVLNAVDVPVAPLILLITFATTVHEVLRRTQPR